MSYHVIEDSPLATCLCHVGFPFALVLSPLSSSLMANQVYGRHPNWMPAGIPAFQYLPNILTFPVFLTPPSTVSLPSYPFPPNILSHSPRPDIVLPLTPVSFPLSSSRPCPLVPSFSYPSHFALDVSSFHVKVTISASSK